VKDTWQVSILPLAVSLPADAGSAPRKVLLFTGHMIDSPVRMLPRFPPQKEAAASDAISRILTHLQVGPADLALCGGACGGDLIFAELALERRVPLQLYLPFAVAQFLRESVDFAGERWHHRFEAVCKQAVVDVMEASGAAPSDASRTSPFERNNLRMLKSALRFGTDRLELIALWDGQHGDGSGGTEHLISKVRNAGIQPHLRAPQLLGI
jgi:hypothetical protein